MALIQCKKCGKIVSDKAANCPHCGTSVLPSDNPSSQQDEGSIKSDKDTVHKNRIPKALFIAIPILLLIVVGGFYFYGRTATNEPTVIITEQFANKLKKYEKLGTFHEGLALVQRNNLWGYIDIQGNEVIPCIYKGSEYGNRGLDFSEGMAAVINKDGKYGFINKKGEIIVKPQFQEVGNFSEGVASVFLDGKLNFVGKNGKFVEALSNKYIWEHNINRNLPQFKNGVCEVHAPIENPSEGETAEVIFIDKKGQKVEQPHIEFKKDLYERYYENGKVGYRDTIGNIVVPAKYTTLGDFSCGVAVATLEYGERGHGVEEWYSDDYVGIYGYVDMNGNETFTHRDYDKIKSAQFEADMKRDREKQEREREEAERRRTESIKSWIQGNWKCNYSYGEVRVGIAENCIVVIANGKREYTGFFTIEDDHIVYDRHNGYSSYIIIDEKNQRLMIDEDTPMQRFRSSSSSNSNSYSGNTGVYFRCSTDVMAYVVGKTFYGNNTEARFDWNALYLNGTPRTAAPHVVRFTDDRAVIKVQVIPSGDLYITVLPREGRLVDEGGLSYYLK